MDCSFQWRYVHFFYCFLVISLSLVVYIRWDCLYCHQSQIQLWNSSLSCSSFHSSSMWVRWALHWYIYYGLAHKIVLWKCCIVWISLSLRPSLSPRFWWRSKISQKWSHFCFIWTWQSMSDCWAVAETKVWTETELSLSSTLLWTLRLILCAQNNTIVRH